MPYWHQWLNYETQLLSRDAIVDLIFQSVEFIIDQKEKYGLFTSSEAGLKRVLLEMDRAVTGEMDNLMKLENKRERGFRIVSMRKNLDNSLLTRKLDMPDNGSDA